MQKKSTNITSDIANFAESYPDNIAIIFGNSRVSYGALFSIVRKGATYLSSIGVKPGDIVAIHAVSDWSTLILMLSIARMGGTVISLPPSTTENQAKEALCDARAKYITGDLKPPFEINLPFIRFDNSIIEKISADDNSFDAAPKAPWIIVSGSGTTGRPKLIPISHQVQRNRNELSQDWLGLKKDDVVASMSHLGFHAPKNRLLETLWAGGTYYLEIYKEMDFFHKCNDNLTVLHATVFHVQKLLHLCRNDSKNYLSIRALTIGGSSVPLGLRTEIKRRLTSNLTVRYASNETGPIAHISQPDVFNGGNCVGKPLSNVNVRIIDERNDVTPDGVIGLIAIDSPANFNGYLNDDASNFKLFTRNGFILGDLGRFDEEGSICHLGRSDNMMIFNGINIYPVEIERALLAHPSIGDAICFPMHHAIHQDIPVAAISLKDHVIVEEKEILSYCKSILGARSPHRVFILTNLPRNERGKIVVANVLAKIKKTLI